MGWFNNYQSPGNVSKETPTDGQVLKYNAATLMWELADAGGAETDPYSVHLDFGNIPTSIPASGWGLVKNGNTLELYVNGTRADSWTVIPVTPDLTGQPIGLLLSLTYPS